MVDLRDGHAYPPRSGVPEITHAPTTSWYRTTWFALVAGIGVLLLVMGGVVAIVATTDTRSTGSSAPSTSASTALEQWWSAARDDFVAVQNASDDVAHAFDRFVPGRLEQACQRVHDTAEVKLQAQLPTPNADLTAEIHAAIEDFHSAAHFCLAVTAGSTANYDAEFFSDMAQANRHMKAAEDIINKNLMGA